MLTVIGRDLDHYDRLMLPRNVRLSRRNEALMLTDFATDEPAPVVGSYIDGWDAHDNIATYWIEIDGRIAAEGSVGVLDDWATFDQIETTPRFRRQGLARQVMDRLTHYAVAANAKHGILVATHDGRLLYESIGWEAVMPLRSYMGFGQWHDPVGL
jgi:GNAT superfamily N-acetyltransferase